jgi:hypothetical protein
MSNSFGFGSTNATGIKKFDVCLIYDLSKHLKYGIDHTPATSTAQRF